ncbi:hypothetical protein Pla175_27820 [Pirellulimonas nuda]|uniref:Uncharacterized protein n=1 Tax=Pirellulimonas nuda TaxID=2528009 RepID=A0A518DD30_9BACT|nr:hypothetical protein Pla175_27820 [Pirellulimonas nuda]
MFGIDHERFTVKFQGLDAKLTGVEPARGITELMACGHPQAERGQAGDWRRHTSAPRPSPHAVAPLADLGHKTKTRGSS